METESSPWGSNDPKKLLAAFPRLIKVTEDIIWNKHRTVISEEDAQQIVHDALFNAFKTFDRTKSDNVEAWWVYKLKNQAIPDFFKRRTMTVDHKHIGRYERIQEDSDKKIDLRSPDDASSGLEQEDKLRFYQNLRDKLDERDQEFLDTMRDCAWEDGNQFVQKAAGRLGISLTDARNRKRHIDKIFRQYRSQYREVMA